MASWITPVVAVEIVLALAVSIRIVQRNYRQQLQQTEASSGPVAATKSALLRPAYCWSLQSLRAFRSIAAVFFVVIQIFAIKNSSGQCFVMYTSWNFMLQGAYFATVAWKTHVEIKRPATEPALRTALVEENGSETVPAATTASNAKSGRFDWIRLDIVLDMCLAASIVIAIIVWAVLQPSNTKDGRRTALLNPVSYSQHGINVLVLQIEIFATHHKVSKDSLGLIMLWVVIYCIFTWIVHFISPTGYWPYMFLKLTTAAAPFWYAGVLFIHIIGFAGVYWLSRGKTACRRSNAEQDEAQNKVVHDQVV